MSAKYQQKVRLQKKAASTIIAAAKEDPLSFITQHKRIAKRYEVNNLRSLNHHKVPGQIFGTVIDYFDVDDGNDKKKKNKEQFFIVEYDNGDRERYTWDDMSKAVLLYIKYKDRDTKAVSELEFEVDARITTIDGITVTVSRSEEGVYRTIEDLGKGVVLTELVHQFEPSEDPTSDLYDPTRDLYGQRQKYEGGYRNMPHWTVEFDRYLATNEINHFDELVNYWTKQQKKYGIICPFEWGIIVTHSKLQVWNAIMCGVLNRDDYDSERELAGESFVYNLRNQENLPFIRAHYWTTVLMCEYIIFLELTTDCKKDEKLAEAIDVIRRFCDINRAIERGCMNLMREMFMYTENDDGEEENLTAESGERISLVFIDTRRFAYTKIENVDTHLPMKEICKLYASMHHVPLEKLNFMHMKKEKRFFLNKTPRELGIQDENSIFVLLEYGPLDELGSRFEKMGETVKCTITEDGDDNDSEDLTREIVMVDTVTYKTITFSISRSTPLTRVFKVYSEYVGIPVKELSFAHENKPGKFIPSISSVIENGAILVSPDPPKKRYQYIPPPEDQEEKCKKIWMDTMASVFIEAEPKFKDIRKKLSEMNLKRSKKKTRSPRAMQTKQHTPTVFQPVDNPSEDGLKGKAGKTQFIVNVGETSNLYNKSTKPSSVGSGRKQDDIMIDLHGLTAKEALNNLDESLPTWIETAMKGTYPFVIPVKIVCGGGSQILAEVVENWIKQNDNVANAPKNNPFGARCA